MKRSVSAHLELDISGRTDMVFSLAVSANSLFNRENLSITLNGEPQHPTELVDRHGTRLHRLIGEAGLMVVDYSAEVAGRSLPAPVDEIDLVTYLRPSRYCESDSLLPTARSEFAGLSGRVTNSAGQRG
jgi:hypothetical protein